MKTDTSTSTVATKRAVPAKPAAMPSATAYYSVRGKIMLGALSAGLLFIAVLVGVIFVRKMFKDQRAERDFIVNEHAEMTRNIDAIKGALGERSQQMAQLQVTPTIVIDRANALARSAGIKPLLITDKVPRFETSLFRGLTSESSPFRVVVRGTPEKIHLFFATLEAQFPSIMVMAISFSPGSGEASSLLEADTTYLVPAYAFSK